MKQLLWAVMMGLFSALSAANAADIRIPPQALGSSLQELAKQSGTQIVFFSKVVEGREAPELKGTFTPEAAVAAPLEGTDLTYHVLNDRTIEIAAKPVVAKVWPVTPEPAAALDEVEILAQRENLSLMRVEIQRLEEKFYAEYNKLTTDPRYHIHCTMEAQSGTGVMLRVCEPELVNREMTPDYQRNMVAIVETHPELLQLIKERNALAQRYEALRSQKLEHEVLVDTRAPTAGQWAISQGYQRVEFNGKQYFCRPPAAVTNGPTRQTCLTLAQLRALRYANSPPSVEGFGNPGVAIAPNAPYIPVQIPCPPCF